ncbi:MAG: hypothetical protein EP343_30655 [Deltaproteobacteria bacterium]|nr:MAG: hypothetical protein EP343_30655 [Deltaproteobacteria bacterium]
MLGSFRNIALMVGLLTVGLLSSGCVYTSQERQYDNRYSRRYGDDHADEAPRRQRRWQQQAPQSRQYRRTRRAYRKYARVARKYRRVIMYCRFNRNKTMRIIQRLRRSMYDTENVGEWRAYKRMQRNYARYLGRYQKCIRRYKRRLAVVQRKQRAYARFLRRKRRYNRGQMYAQRGPLWQKQPNAKSTPNVNPSPSSPNGGGPLNAPPEAQPPEPPSDDSSNSTGSTAKPNAVQPKAKTTPAPSKKSAAPPSFPVYRPPTGEPAKPSTQAKPKVQKDPLNQAVPSTPGLDSGDKNLSQPPSTGTVTPNTPNQQVVPSPKKSTPAPLPQPEPDLPMSASDKQAISRWRNYCASEVRKYPLVHALRGLGQKSLKNSDSAPVNLFQHTTSESIQGIHGSGLRYVVLGTSSRYSQAHCTDRVYKVWDTQKQAMVQVQPAVTSYFLKNRYLLPWFMGKKHSSVEEELVSFNPLLRRGGLMLRVPMPALKKRYRYQYLVWDSKSNRIVRAWTLGMPGCHSAYRSIGTDPYGRTFYYLQSERAVFGACRSARPLANSGKTYYYRLMALDLTSGERRTIARFAPSMKRLEAIVPTRDFSRIAVVQYTELSPAKGSAFVIETSNGVVRRFNAPITPYGVVFSQDQQSLLIYSSKGGVLQKTDLRSGQTTLHKTYRLGHAMGLSADGKRLSLVFHSGVEIRNATTLKRLKFVPHRPMMGKSKFVHVGGSAVLGGTLFVKNGEKLYIRRAP